MADVGTGAQRVVLVRHARPVIDPATPAREWALHDDAATEVLRLAAALRSLGADGIVTSPEPKALGTARVLAHALGLPLAEDASLREQGGEAVPWLDDEAFRRAVANHFARPDEIVFGAESSEAAVNRFRDAIGRARSRHCLPVIVSHGRIMCGFIGETVGVDPVTFWEGLRMPDAFVLDPGRGSCVRIEVTE